MFNAEADVLAHLSAHPSIVTVYQAGISADGRPYIVMEYCPGSLAQRYRIERIPVDEVLADRRADGERARVGAPRRARPPRRQAEQHPHHDASAPRCSPTSASRRRCSARPPTRCSRCRSRGARPRWSPSRRRAPSRARCGASARPCTRCSPATARSSAASAARTPRSSCAVASLRASYTRHRAHRRAGVAAGRARDGDEPGPGAPLRLAPASSPRRCARCRPSSASRRRRSRSPTTEWSAASGPVDFADTALRGPARSHLERDDTPQDARRRRRRGARARRGHRVLGAARRRARSALPWIVGGSAPVAVVGAAAVVVDALRDGGALMRPPARSRASSPSVAAGRSWPRSSASASSGRVWTRRRPPTVDTAVWALQTGEGRRYARVNTTVGELDTVRSVSNPDKVVQTGDAAYLFSDSFSKVTRIDEALPADLDDEALRGVAVDAGRHDRGRRRRATSSAYLTDSGAVFAGRLVERRGRPARPVPHRRRGRPAVHGRRDRGR